MNCKLCVSGGFNSYSNPNPNPQFLPPKELKAATRTAMYLDASRGLNTPCAKEVVTFVNGPSS